MSPWSPLAEDPLASDGTSGRLLIDSSQPRSGLGGALLLDVVVQGRIVVMDGHLTAVDKAPTGEPLLDSALADVAGQDRRHEPGHWIRHLSRGAASPRLLRHPAS